MLSIQLYFSTNWKFGFDASNSVHITSERARFKHEIHKATDLAFRTLLFFTSSKNITPISGIKTSKLSIGMFTKYLQNIKMPIMLKINLC
jgi:hypothetical protein